MTDLLVEFNQITRLLNESNIDYAICGGWAMAIHGVPRATVDIDFIVLAQSLQKVFEIAASCGYRLEAEPMQLKNGQIEIRRVSKIELETRLVYTLDFLIVTPALEKIWAEREQVEWENGMLTVVSRTGLIELKELAGRTQDLADIERLKELDDES